jgi:hypothetical protein
VPPCSWLRTIRLSVWAPSLSSTADGVRYELQIRAANQPLRGGIPWPKRLALFVRRWRLHAPSSVTPGDVPRRGVTP